MPNCACQGNKDTASRKDSAVAVSVQDKQYLDKLASKEKKSIKDVLATVIESYRAGPGTVSP